MASWATTTSIGLYLEELKYLAGISSVGERIGHCQVRHDILAQQPMSTEFASVGVTMEAAGARSISRHFPVSAVLTAVTLVNTVEAWRIMAMPAMGHKHHI